MTSFIFRCTQGVRRHPWRTIASTALAYAALWTALEPGFSFLDIHVNDGGLRFGAFVAVSALAGIVHNRLPAMVRVKAGETVVNIHPCDLFTHDGPIVVSVNDFFDSSLGKLVAEASVHGQMLVHKFGREQEQFDALVRKALNDEAYEIEARGEGNDRRYRQGTIAAVRHGSSHLFLAALGRTGLDHTVSASPQDLWLTLENLWISIRTHAEFKNTAIAIMGGGMTQVRLPRAKLLDFILLSLASANRAPGEITVCVYPNEWSEIDARALARSWPPATTNGWHSRR